MPVLQSNPINTISRSATTRFVTIFHSVIIAIQCGIGGALIQLVAPFITIAHAIAVRIRVRRIGCD
jgi:hypothetical protein